MNKISFIGLGKLGLPLCTSFGKNGTKILAIDVNQKVINSLQNGKAPFYEKGLDENISKSIDNITYTNNYDGVENTEASIILVNTPSVKKDGSFSNIYVEQSIASICEKVRNKEYHLFIISSTVMPGSLNDSFIPLIENLNNWKCGVNFDICYIPDFVALGSVIDDFEKPEFVIIGSNSSEAADRAEKLYNKIFKNSPPVKKMSLIEAELAKVSLNAYVCMKISFSNFLGNICEKYDNANPDNITSAIGIDKRISTNYFKSGLAFGGTCFPRDTWAFMKVSEKLGLNAAHIEAAEKINQQQNKLLINKILNCEKNKIAILGLSFKNGTPVINESPSIKVIENLLINNKQICCYDPVDEAVSNTKDIFKDKITYCSSYEDCISQAECIVVLNPMKKYNNIPQLVNKDHIVIDCWRYFEDLCCEHISLGIKE